MNHWPWHDEASVPPLCYCCWPSKCFFLPFSPPSASSIGFTWTLQVKIKSWEFYHCATSADCLNTSICHFLPPDESSIDCTWTLDLEIKRWEFYHCASAADYLTLCHFLPPCGIGCTWTIDLGMMRQVFHHCATAVDHLNASFFIFSLIVPAALVLHEPSSAWDKEFRVVLLCYFCRLSEHFSLPVSTSRWKQHWLHLNSWPRDKEVRVLPLRYCCWPLNSLPFSPSLWQQHWLTLAWWGECYTTVTSAGKPNTAYFMYLLL